MYEPYYNTNFRPLAKIHLGILGLICYRTTDDEEGEDPMCQVRSLESFALTRLT